MTRQRGECDGNCDEPILSKMLELAALFVFGLLCGTSLGVVLTLWKLGMVTSITGT